MISRRWETRRDHPRSRGVYRIICQSRAQTGGSSPLARGLPHADEPVRHRPGIIPARAGFTYRGHRDARSIPGSSPLARGLPTGAARCRAGGGIIPARAGFTWGRGARAMRGRDHPRSRGVYSMWRYSRGEAEGSSPLARGLLGETAVPVHILGIIPARAGFTVGGGIVVLRAGDHPRSRGVYPGYGGNLDLNVWIIPARAGFTPDAAILRVPARDHPRSRGVYRPRTRLGSTRLGSSPLARGLLEAAGRAGAARGIIPARAGFTHGVFVSIRVMSGSSPLARGLPPQGARRAHLRGIIPARAGFTRAHTVEINADEDHPRSRGVYRRSSPRCRGARGSSPLARGLHCVCAARAACGGIIPARAGFTRIRGTGPFSSADHPRSRGVYLRFFIGQEPDEGSSPLARGLPTHRLPTAIRPRIIPARAGFTHPRLSTPAPRAGSSPLARGLRLVAGAGHPATRIIPARAGFTPRRR